MYGAGRSRKPNGLIGTSAVCVVLLELPSLQETTTNFELASYTLKMASFESKLG